LALFSKGSEGYINNLKKGKKERKKIAPSGV
jgi:hypothetical protein